MSSLPLLIHADVEPPEWDELKKKLLELLGKRKSTLKEIERSLGLNPSYRTPLLLLLSFMKAEGLIESEELIIPVGGGLIRTRVFMLKPESS